MKDLFTYDNGKPLVSPQRRGLASRIVDAESLLDRYCRGEVAIYILRNSLYLLHQHIRHDGLLRNPDPWVTEVNERIQAIEAKVALLKASGQL